MEQAFSEYGLIGYPLGHSFSKTYFNEKFEREKLFHCQFEAFAIPNVEVFPDLLQLHPQLKGLSVTIPYKEQILKYVDELSPEVAAIGATNSIRICNGKLKAYNTDIIGFEISFKEKLQPHHRQALVLGTGGASKAVQYVLAKMQMPFLVVTRTPQASNQISYAELNAVTLQQYPCIINCTPVGMYPDSNECPPIPYEALTAENYLYDLVYKPEQTRFLLKGMMYNATVKNGFDMLLLQAEASWKIWNETT
jgi:shikimate dehydrogenase